MPVPVRHFLQLNDLDRDEIAHLFARTRIIKEHFKQYRPYHPLC